MPRIFGTDIPGKKKVAFALRYIYGIGPTRADAIVAEAGFSEAMRADQLTEQDINRVMAICVEKGFKVEGDLRREVVGDIKRLQNIRCYRGIRHYRGLPVRGQRTSTNARTRKGARKTVGVVRSKE
ncbi:MAG: 30S ribosomal protein S13 [Puniceicoccales bacterium]|jgi:small subunit ribosomal protein S13|nr:30S ribosomal protein S13 [Puniceicoccales bacterium]